MTVSITIQADTAAIAREEMLALIGGGLSPAYRGLGEPLTPGEQARADELLGLDDNAADLAAQKNAMAASGAIIGAATGRKRGEPGEGRARRTKAEMAEDAEADAKDAAAVAAALNAGTVNATEPASEQSADAPEVEQQDAADEAHEAATEVTSTLTHDDVRSAAGRYVQAFGMDAAQQDGTKVFHMLFGEKVNKIGEIPGDQESLRKTIAGLDEAIAKNPFDRKHL